MRLFCTLRGLTYTPIAFVVAMVLSGCYKKPLQPDLPSPMPSVSDSLAVYTITEVGDSLASNPDFYKSINGYTDKISYYPGEKVTLYLSGPPGTGNTNVVLQNMWGKTVVSFPTPIPSQVIKNKKPWVDGFGYMPTLTYSLPANLKSGMYTWAGNIPLICKGNDASYDVTVVYPTNTMNAYNDAGGKSLYAPNFANRATVLSFQRSATIFYIQFYKWLATLPYNINYIADSDLDSYGSIQNSKVVMIVGHSEYWTRQARENIDKFIASGRNVLFLSGDNMWWQIRYNSDRTKLICYKSLIGAAWQNASLDPLVNTPNSTVNWGTTSIGYSISPDIGAEYRNGGYGDVIKSVRWNGYKIVAANSPVFKGTGLANGDVLTVPTREYDGAPMEQYYHAGSNQIPVIDTSKLHCYRAQLLGFDYAQNLIVQDQLGYGTFVLFKKTATSGTVANVGSMDWAEDVSINGVDGQKVRTISKNLIDLSISGASLFNQ